MRLGVARLRVCVSVWSSRKKKQANRKTRRCINRSHVLLLISICAWMSLLFLESKSHSFITYKCFFFVGTRPRLFTSFMHAFSHSSIVQSTYPTPLRQSINTTYPRPCPHLGTSRSPLPPPHRPPPPRPPPRPPPPRPPNRPPPPPPLPPPCQLPVLSVCVSWNDDDGAGPEGGGNTAPRLAMRFCSSSWWGLPCVYVFSCVGGGGGQHMIRMDTRRKERKKEGWHPPRDNQKKPPHNTEPSTCKCPLSWSGLVNCFRQRRQKLRRRSLASASRCNSVCLCARRSSTLHYWRFCVLGLFRSAGLRGPGRESVLISIVDVHPTTDTPPPPPPSHSYKPNQKPKTHLPPWNLQTRQ